MGSEDALRRGSAWLHSPGAEADKTEQEQQFVSRKGGAYYPPSDVGIHTLKCPNSRDPASIGRQEEIGKKYTCHTPVSSVGPGRAHPGVRACCRLPNATTSERGGVCHAAGSSAESCPDGTVRGKPILFKNKRDRCPDEWE